MRGSRELPEFVILPARQNFSCGGNVMKNLISSIARNNLSCKKILRCAQDDKEEKLFVLFQLCATIK